jgi:CRISPR-associated exonuclease Cas4
VTLSSNPDSEARAENVLSILDSVNGTMINYYHVCPRKLWLFSRGLGREQDSPLVEMGRLVHEQSFSRREREILVFGRIKIDHATTGETLVIHEVKKTRSQPHAARAQTLFYLFVMDQLGVKCRGEIHYRSQKRRVPVELNPESREETRETIQAIREILASPVPPDLPTHAPCSRCAYKDYCRM